MQLNIWALDEYKNEIPLLHFPINCSLKCEITQNLHYIRIMHDMPISEMVSIWHLHG